ncbi:MAG TPA: hypothetical protein VNF99_15750 [Stellaceae bacterium]|nr:hypothetical protein [Stellaceae bacterium]
MSVSKLSGVARAVLVTLALLASSAQGARAETIFLTCINNAASVDKDNFVVDLTNNTVNSSPANIDATAIDWQVKGSANQYGYVVKYYHIDRTAGTLTETDTFHLANGRISSVKIIYSCTKGSAPPTKF